MKKKIVSDVKIVCDPPIVPYYLRNSQEDIANYYESWIKDFESFMRDHRSQDPVKLSVEYEYQNVCSFCGLDWEEDWNYNCPTCCQEAIEEFERNSLTS